jgi:hypothetical protein
MDFFKKGDIGIDDFKLFIEVIQYVVTHNNYKIVSTI